MGCNDFQEKLSGLSDEQKKVFVGWYDYINKTLGAHPQERNIKQQSLEQEVKKAEAGLSNRPSVEEWQAKKSQEPQLVQDGIPRVQIKIPEKSKNNDLSRQPTIYPSVTKT